MWLNGMHTVGWSNDHWDPKAWVSSGSKKPSLTDIELDFLDYKKMLKKAADRIDKMFWFGILEDLDKSLTLLSVQLNYGKQVR